MDRIARPLQYGDHEMIRDWYRGWLMKPVPRELLPETGLIVNGVCAGFLYLTNSGLGLIEGYISNPEASPELRSEGLDELTSALLSLAKEKGVVVVKCETRLSQVAERALKFEFKEIPGVRSLIRRLD